MVNPGSLIKSNRKSHQTWASSTHTHTHTNSHAQTLAVEEKSNMLHWKHILVLIFMLKYFGNSQRKIVFKVIVDDIKQLPILDNRSRELK